MHPVLYRKKVTYNNTIEKKGEKKGEKKRHVRHITCLFFMKNTPPHFVIDFTIIYDYNKLII